jgi:hypothetical protein
MRCTNLSIRFHLCGGVDNLNTHPACGFLVEGVPFTVTPQAGDLIAMRDVNNMVGLKTMFVVESRMHLISANQGHLSLLLIILSPCVFADESEMLAMLHAFNSLYSLKDFKPSLISEDKLPENLIYDGDREDG